VEEDGSTSEDINATDVQASWWRTVAMCVIVIWCTV